MKGQYSDTEFKEMLLKVGILKSSVNYTTLTAWIKIRSTVNYYYQNDDLSWTNYDCRTVYN